MQSWRKDYINNIYTHRKICFGVALSGKCYVCAKWREFTQSLSLEQCVVGRRCILSSVRRINGIKLLALDA